MRTLIVLLVLVAGCSDVTASPSRAASAANFTEHGEHGRAGSPQFPVPNWTGSTWYATGKASQAIRQLQAAEVGCPPSVVAIIEGEIAQINAAVTLAGVNGPAVYADISGRVFFDAGGKVAQSELKQDIVTQ